MPENCSVHASGRGVVLLFGGFGPDGFLNDTWAWDGSAWTDVTPASGNPPGLVLTAMAYNILRMHRRYLSKLIMDEIIEHLQINLEKDFGFDDDVVIERLRDVMHELRSQRMDSPGRTPADEMPQKPFGIVPTSLSDDDLKNANTTESGVKNSVSVST